MAVFPGLLVPGVNLIPFVSEKANSVTWWISSHLCAVIELNLEPGRQTKVCRFSEPLLEFLGVWHY